MSILIDQDTKVIIQGITGNQGRYHTQQMLEYGTKIVAGTSPGKEGEEVFGVPVFNSIENALKEKNANCSIIFVPAKFAKDAVFEALENEIKLIVVITEHIPFHDSMKFIHYAKYKDAIIIGPNTPGIVSVGKSKVGILPNKIFKNGNVGVVSRSGTLTYEIVNELSNAGLGQTTCIGLGGDRVIGLSFIDVLKMFEKDKETEKVVLVGEIGGSEEENACKYIKKMRKKVVGYIAGQSAVEGKKMGHAGAIVLRGKGTAQSKIKALNDVGVEVAKLFSDLPNLLK